MAFWKNNQPDGIPLPPGFIRYLLLLFEIIRNSDKLRRSSFEARSFYGLPTAGLALTTLPGKSMARTLTLPPFHSGLSSLAS